MISARTTLLLAVVLLWSCPAVAAEPQVIHWAYFDKPPLFLQRDDGQVDGVCGRIGALVRKGLPEYSHRWLRMPVPRILDEMRKGRRICAVGMIRTAGREKFLTYSLPCRLVSPSMLALRRDTLKTLALREGAISLERLLGNGRLVVGRLEGMSYGNSVDSVFERNGDSPAVEKLYGDQGTTYLYRMLRARRVDAVPVDLFEAIWKGFSRPDSDIMVVPMQENRSFSAGYITCPGTDWGEQVIARVNRVLHEAVLKASYFNYFSPYLTDEIEPQAKEAFSRLIQTPAMRMERQ